MACSCLQMSLQEQVCASPATAAAVVKAGRCVQAPTAQGPVAQHAAELQELEGHAQVSAERLHSPNAREALTDASWAML